MSLTLSCSVWPPLPEARMTPGAQDEVRIGMERVIGYILDIICSVCSEHEVSWHKT